LAAFTIYKNGERPKLPQAVRPHGNTVFPGIFQKKVQIGLTVFIIEENRSVIVAAMRNVMLITGGNDAGDTWHGGMLAQR
jgi:hypothetical protein